MPSRMEVENCIRILLDRYNADYAILFGSYARGEETLDSDIDVVVCGGANFKKTNIFSFAEELREKAVALEIAGKLTSFRHMFDWNLFGVLFFGPMIATQRFFDTLNKVEIEINKKLID